MQLPVLTSVKHRWQPMYQTNRPQSREWHDELRNEYVSNASIGLPLGQHRPGNCKDGIVLTYP